MSALYLHIPFCAGKCPYCDFFSTAHPPLPLADYVELLLLDLQQLRKSFPHSPPFETIYFGGGTPSLLSAQQIEQLLTRIQDLFGRAEGAEITLEANPGDLSAELLHAYRQAAINRLSLGVQSLNDDFLRLLGRRHSAAQAAEAVALARAAGFDNLSLDLIFALPGQGLRALDQDLAALLALAPEHVSLYGLTFEPGTPLTVRRERGELAAVNDDLYVEQYHLLANQLEQAGFEHYEISNFARPGRRCRHNQGYWRRQSCLAVGAGGHGFSARGWGERRHIPADLEGYQSRLQNGDNPAEVLETFDRLAAMKEYAYLALRTSDGIEQRDFERRFGCSFERAFPEALKKLRGQLHNDGSHWFLKRSGWLLYDHLISEFL